MFASGMTNVWGRDGVQERFSKGPAFSLPYFDVLGTQLAAGRTFSPEENATAATHPVTVISHSLWLRAFAGEPRAIGASVSLNGVLAIVGLYGVLSYLVVQRTREIGIRVALGATHSGVVRLVVGRGLRLAVLGIGLGVDVAVLASRSVTAFLYGIEITDAVTWIGVPLALLVVAWLASLVPAHRASRVDPVTGIRAD